MKPANFHSDAYAEMVAAAVYYESQQEDLGKRFLTSLQSSISHIQINPKLYQHFDFGVQICVLFDFPFKIVFREKLENIEIIAIMHQRRKPYYWKNR